MRTNRFSSSRTAGPAPARVPHLRYSTEPPFAVLQRVAGNAAVARLLQRQATPTTTETPPPATDAAAPAAPLPQVDMAPRDRGRAFQMDWDRHHTEIAGIQANETLRQAFELHLFEQLDRRLPDVFNQCTSHAEAERLLRERIQAAQNTFDDDEAERLEREWNIALQFAVVETLDVEHSARYAPVEGGPTYCNIYAYDVIAALGGYLPRVWWNDDVIPRIRAGEAVEAVYGETIHEMNANALTRWFMDYGADFGWEAASDMTEAQEAANNGELAIIVAANANPRRSGHITVVMAETAATTDSAGTEATRNEAGEVIIPTQSQAGRTNLQYGTTRSSWWERGHVNGGAYIFRGARHSQLLAPEQSLMPDGVIGRLPGRRRR